MGKQRKSRAEGQAPPPGLPDARTVAEGCRLLHADTVNVAVSPRSVALTFYATVPDPAVMEGKGLVRYAQAVIQLPLGVAAQLPRLINQILWEHLDLASAVPEDIDAVVREMQEVADQSKRKREQVRSDLAADTPKA